MNRMQKIIIHLLTAILSSILLSILGSIILYILSLEEISSYIEKFSSFMDCLHLKLSNLYDYINSFSYIKKVKDYNLSKKTYDFLKNIFKR